MNTVQMILNSLTDDELKEAVAEMKELELTGVLPSGRVRSLANRLLEEANVPTPYAITLAESEVLRVAAYKWAGV